MITAQLSPPPIRHPILYMTPTLLVTNAPKLYVRLVPAFVTLLALGGQVGLPILVLTCLRSKRLNRHSTFVNCCVTSIIYSLVFCILIYTGQYRRAVPNHALCVAQASMVMAVLPMVSVAVLMFVLQIWATFQDPGSAIFVTFEKRYMLFILLAFPYVTFFGYLIGSILVASRPDAVWNYNGLYCFFKPRAMAHYLGPLSCLVPLAMTAVLEAAILVQWFRRWHNVKRVVPLAVKKAQALICFRASLFNVYTWLSLAATVSFQERTPSVSYLTEAGVPLVAFLVFGTQRDILGAWRWRREEDSSETHDQEQDTSITCSTNEEMGLPCS